MAARRGKVGEISNFAREDGRRRRDGAEQSGTGIPACDAWPFRPGTASKGSVTFPATSLRPARARFGKPACFACRLPRLSGYWCKMVLFPKNPRKSLTNSTGQVFAINIIIWNLLSSSPILGFHLRPESPPVAVIIIPCPCRSSPSRPNEWLSSDGFHLRSPASPGRNAKEDKNQENMKTWHATFFHFLTENSCKRAPLDVFIPFNPPNP